MSKRIITISREFGSGGRTIGKMVADQLGFDFYDKELIEKIAEETGFSKKFIEEYGEHAPGMQRRIILQRSPYGYSVVMAGLMILATAVWIM